MSSSVVHAAVICLLLSNCGSASCAVSPDSGAEASQAEQIGSARGGIYLAPGRVDVIPPTTPIKLAEENEVPLHIQSPGLVEVETDQAQYNSDDLQTRKLPPTRPEGGYAVLPILYHSDGSPYVKVVPRRLGKIVLEVRALFPDGGFTKTDAILDVVPPSRSPQRLFVSEDGFSGYGIIYAYLKPQSDRWWLAVSAAYEGVKEPFLVYPSYATFKIRTANDASIIGLDATTGIFTPLQPGEALVKTTFGNLTALTCVVVAEENDPNRTGPPQSCKSLLVAGEKLTTLNMLSKAR